MQDKMQDEVERQSAFTEAAERTAGDPAAQRKWASSLPDAELSYYVERARAWVNTSSLDPREISSLAGACEQVFSERNPDSM
jgi:hypothetical protein